MTGLKAGGPCRERACRNQTALPGWIGGVTNQGRHGYHCARLCPGCPAPLNLPVLGLCAIGLVADRQLQLYYAVHLASTCCRTTSAMTPSTLASSTPCNLPQAMPSSPTLWPTPRFHCSLLLLTSEQLRMDGYTSKGNGAQSNETRKLSNQSAVMWASKEEETGGLVRHDNGANRGASLNVWRHASDSICYGQCRTGA